MVNKFCAQTLVETSTPNEDKMPLLFSNTGIAVVLFAVSFAQGANFIWAQTANTSKGTTTAFSTGNRQLYSQLIEQLLSNADPMVPPNADNVSQPVEIHITFSLNFVQQLEMNDQILAIFAGFQIQWYDRSLSWDMDLCPVDTIFLKADRIWRPELVLYNSIGPRDQVMKLELQVKIKYDGLVTWNPGALYQYRCLLDMRLFPFDTQRCALRLGPLIQAEKHVNCTQYHARSVRQPHPEWDVLGIDVKRVEETRDGKSWYIEYTVVLKRKWMFYVMNVIFPILLVSALNNVVLILPVECGEKMSVSVTTFLTLAVFMTLIKDSLPSNSDTVCYLAVYLGTQMILSVVVVILSAVIVKYHHTNCHTCVVSSSQGQKCKTDKKDITAHEVPNASESLIL